MTVVWAIGYSRVERIFSSARGVRGMLKPRGSIGRLAAGSVWLNSAQLSSGAAPVFSNFLSSREIKNPFPGLPRVPTLSPEQFKNNYFRPTLQKCAAVPRRHMPPAAERDALHATLRRVSWTVQRVFSARGCETSNPAGGI